MIQKKVCMLGSFAVGKTSLVRRYVDSIFSDKYHTTVGVKIDKKLVSVKDNEVLMMLWDLAGEDELSKIKPSYLRGSAGYVLVVDSTRSATLDKALEIQSSFKEHLSDKPFVLVINKCDLKEGWALDNSMLEKLMLEGWEVIQTSALSGSQVEETFQRLAEQMINNS